MLLLDLAKTFEAIENTRSNRSMREILSRFFSSVTSKEIGMVVNLMQGQLAPPYEGITLGMAERMAIRAIAIGFGKNEKNPRMLFLLISKDEEI